jgi:hypothetical protein
MNFFGHAAVAGWYSPEPGFVLGAMLPDFLAMIRARPAPQHVAEVASGVGLHHATDAAFHDSTDFLRLTHEGRSALAAEGLERGPARATAHIGVELLLDEVLARDPASRHAYLGALSYGSGAPYALDLATAEQAEHMAQLLTTLEGRGVPMPPPSDGELARRIDRMLAGRPRLQLGQGGAELVARWLGQARHAVDAAAPGLLSRLRAHLDRLEWKS